MADPEVNPFVYQEGFAHILSGEEEALYAWITINYLNGFFSGNQWVVSYKPLILNSKEYNLQKKYNEKSLRETLLRFYVYFLFISTFDM